MTKRKQYWELLRDPQWQKKRLQIMERAKFCCERCDSASETLNVHHTYYEKGLNPWDYPDKSLWCLCESCHSEAEELRAKLGRQIGRLTWSQCEELLGYARALQMLLEENVRCEAENYEVLSGMMRAVSTPMRQFNSLMTCAIQIAQEEDGTMTEHLMNCAVLQAEQIAKLAKGIHFVTAESTP